MKIWIVREGEALPIDKEGRLMRAGMLAKHLAESGHKVTWWSSTFIHGSKTYYCNEYKEICVNNNETLCLLHSKKHYKKNVSFARLIYNRNLGKEFMRKSAGKEKPDIIVCCWPIPDFAKASVIYGEKNNVPVILDVRDLWPDIYKRAFPNCLQWLAKIAVKPLQYSAGKVFSKATGITGVLPNNIEWACAYVGRKPNKKDATIFIGSNAITLTKEEAEKVAEGQWKEFTKNTWNICFIGTLSASSSDIKTVISAVEKLANKYPEIHFWIGGNGDAKAEIEKIVKQCNHVHYLGWLNKLQMESLLRISKCGMFCYKNLEDFKNGFGNKIIQYMSAGLPVINSTQGYAKKFLKEHNAGLTYEEGNVDDCMSTIEYLYLNEDLCKEMAENSFKQFEHKFEENIVSRQFEEHICKVVKMYREEHNYES